MLLSTHLIDEVADLLDQVLVLQAGRVALAGDAAALRSEAVVIAGPAGPVEEVSRGLRCLHQQTLGGFRRATLLGHRGADERELVQTYGLQVQPASLQQLVARVVEPCPHDAPADLRAGDQEDGR